MISTFFLQSGVEYTVYGQAGDFNGFADTDRNTCFVERHDENGSVLQIGVSESRNSAYIGVFTQANIDVEAESFTTVHIDGMVFHPTSYGAKDGRLIDGYQGAYLKVTNEDFAIATGSEMEVAPQDPSFNYIVSLEGVTEAMTMGYECNQSMAR